MPVEVPAALELAVLVKVALGMQEGVAVGVPVQVCVGGDVAVGPTVGLGLCVEGVAVRLMVVVPAAVTECTGVTDQVIVRLLVHDAELVGDRELVYDRVLECVHVGVGARVRVQVRD